MNDRCFELAERLIIARFVARKNGIEDNITSSSNWLLVFIHLLVRSAIISVRLFFGLSRSPNMVTVSSSISAPASSRRRRQQRRRRRQQPPRWRTLPRSGGGDGAPMVASSRLLPLKFQRIEKRFFKKNTPKSSSSSATSPDNSGMLWLTTEQALDALGIKQGGEVTHKSEVKNS